MNPTDTLLDEPAAASDTLELALATEEDRQSIYQIRHRIYAEELGQHPVNGQGRLTDALDERNAYLVVRQAGRIAGFISVTPPGMNYSLDKYVERAGLPVTFDDGLYEIRLLTVLAGHRGWRVASLLMYGALEYVAARGGRQIAAIGRVEVVELYRRVGLLPAGIRVRAGAVEYEVMTATVARVQRCAADLGPTRRRIIQDARIDPDIAPPKQKIKQNRPDFASCYHGGAFFDAIGPGFETLDRRHDIINADVLDAPFDPAPGVLTALHEHLPWLLRTSPPTHCQGMIDAIAAARGVPPACVLPGGGSSDLIYLALRHWLSPASRVLILDPMYGEYAHVLERVIGCKPDRLTLRRSHRYDLNIAELRARLQEKYDLVILVNPNSPTGRHVGREALQDLIASAPRQTRFWIDETYIDYVSALAGDQSLERFAAGREGVAVRKSMSKVYALSGARAAYLCGARETIDPLRTINPPWAVSLPGQVAAVAALRDPAYYRARLEQVALDRADLAAAIEARLGFEVIPGVANFLLCHMPDDGPTAAELVAACRSRSLFLRDVSSMGTSLGQRALRVAVKDHATNQKMLDIMLAAME